MDKNRSKDILRIVLISLLLVMVLITSGLWLFSSDPETVLLIYLPLGIIIAFVVFILYGRVKNYRNKLVSEDELSKKIRLKAGNTSFLISLYVWLILYYVHGRYETENYIFGIGIMAMAVTYAISYWIYSRFVKIDE